MKIRLFCAVGMSTSLVVARMKEAAKKRGIDADIEAFSVNDLEKQKDGCDAILIGPQIGFQLEKIRAACPGVPVEVINMQDYGLANGDAVLTTALKMIEDNKK